MPGTRVIKRGGSDHSPATNTFAAQMEKAQENAVVKQKKAVKTTGPKYDNGA